MREDVVAALEAHFAAGRPRGVRLFQPELHRRGLYGSNITLIAYERQAELVERWRLAAVETGRGPDDDEFEEDSRTMIWLDGLLSALALVEQGILP